MRAYNIGKLRLNRLGCFLYLDFRPCRISQDADYGKGLSLIRHVKVDVRRIPLDGIHGLVARHTADTVGECQVYRHVEHILDILDVAGRGVEGNRIVATGFGFREVHCYGDGLLPVLDAFLEGDTG